MKTPHWITIALLLAAAPACSRNRGATANHAAANHAPLPEVTVDDLAARIQRGERVALFDANGRERYEQGHIPGARWVGHEPLTAAALPADRATPLVFYCANER